MSVTGTAKDASRPLGRPIRLGSPEAAAADRDRRRREYADLRAKLAMPSGELADLLGMSRATVKTMPWWRSPSSAPTDATLAKMRRELLKRTRERIEELREWREIELAEIQRELDEHMASCRAAEPEGLETGDGEAA
jgi:hypothetical protein